MIAFCFQADESESTSMKDIILTTYEKALGQAINLVKSEVYFNRNTPKDTKEIDKSSILGVSECLGTGK